MAELIARTDLTEGQRNFILRLGGEKLTEKAMLFLFKNKFKRAISRRTLRAILGRLTDMPKDLVVSSVEDKKEQPVLTDKLNLNVDKMLITCFVVGGEIDTYAYSELENYINEGFSVFVIPLEGKRKTKFNQQELSSIKADLPLLPNGARYLLDNDIRIERYNINILNLYGSRQSYTHLRHIKKHVIVPETSFTIYSTPTELNSPPTYLFTTGCINKKSRLYSKNHLGYLQEEQHKLGGIFIENGLVTQATFKSKREFAEALVVGDLHLPYENKMFIRNLKKQLETHRPKKVFLHDLLDLAPFSHHTHKNVWAKLNKDNTTEHLKQIRDKITGLIALCDNFGVEIYVVASNHDTHLMTGLMTQSLSKMNKEDATLYFQYGSLVLSENKKPLEAIFKVCGVSDSDINKLNFIDVKTGCESAGFTLNLHGDAGINGASFSSGGFKRIGAKAIVGHSHSCSRDGDVLTTGTSSKLLLGYNERGFSSWSDANVIVKKTDAYHEILIGDAENENVA